MFFLKKQWPLKLLSWRVAKRIIFLTLSFFSFSYKLVSKFPHLNISSILDSIFWILFLFSDTYQFPNALIWYTKIPPIAILFHCKSMLYTTANSLCKMHTSHATSLLWKSVLVSQYPQDSWTWFMSLHIQPFILPASLLQRNLCHSPRKLLPFFCLKFISLTLFIFRPHSSRKHFWLSTTSSVLPYPVYHITANIYRANPLTQTYVVHEARSCSPCSFLNFQE